MFEGTPEEQEACRRDSIRFCKKEVPDSFRGCLKANRDKISKGCRAVLTNHGQ